jgi:signal transduction histidine kinase
MQRVFARKPSLVSILVLAFILASVAPMLLASNIAMRLVYSSVNANLEYWLRASANYLFQTVDETVGEMTALHTLLSTRVSQPEIDFSQEELVALAHLDADVLLLKGAGGKVLFTTHPEYSIDEKFLYPGSPLKWVNLGNGKKELGIAVKKTLTALDGSVRSLEMVCWFKIELAMSGGRKPIELRILVPDGGRFSQAYSSYASLSSYKISAQAINIMRNSVAGYFIPDADWTDNTPNANSLLLPIKNKQGELQAVFVISAIMLPFNEDLPSSATMFWSFFIIGTVLSGCIGLVLAKRLVKPLKKINEGVRGIALGNLGQRVAVTGASEIVELGSGFNLMAGQLEIMKREGQQSVRRERSSMLGEIALGFAHEIRNPLVVIKTSAEVVHSGLKDNSHKDSSKDAKLLGFVIEEVGRIDRLISEFLSFAKPAPIVLQYFNLYPLLKEIVEISKAEFSKRNINCTLVDETDAKSGQGDRVLGESNQIRQVVLNLLLNAMDAMPDGGDINIRLYTEKNASGSTPKVCLDVRDTGVGIAEDILPTIYMPFISTKGNGLGLGLAKVHAIIDEHGGSIACVSKPGEGTLFTICLNAE